MRDLEINDWGSIGAFIAPLTLIRIFTSKIALGAGHAQSLWHQSPNTFCVLSPNMNTIPEPPSPDRHTMQDLTLKRYADGTYGPHDYALLPQFYHPDFPHLPCIPSPGHVDGLSTDISMALWSSLAESDYHPLEIGSPWVRISDNLHSRLLACLPPLEDYVSQISTANNVSVWRLRNVLKFARHSILHLRFTDGHSLPTLINIHRGCQRNILECYGYVVYHRLIASRCNIVRPPLPCPGNMLGVFTSQLDIAEIYWAAGVPVYRITDVVSLLPDLCIRHRVSLAVRPYPALFEHLATIVDDYYIAKLQSYNPSQAMYTQVSGYPVLVGSINMAGSITAPALLSFATSSTTASSSKIRAYLS